MSLFDRIFGSPLSDLEKKAIDKDWTNRMSLSLKEQKNLYEIKLEKKQSEINRLNSIIEKNAKTVEDAEVKEFNAKCILQKAKEMIDEVDECYKTHSETTALVHNNLVNIKEKLTVFAEKLLPE